MKILIPIVLCALCGITSVFGASSEPLGWKVENIGKDSCNPEVGCTIEWALSQSGWPDEVTKNLTALVQTTTPETHFMEGDWRGWMTAGMFVPKFYPEAFAQDWPANHVEPANYWWFDYMNQRYNLIRVKRCQNWAGWISEVPPKVIAPEPPQERPPLGSLPVVTCPPK